MGEQAIAAGRYMHYEGQHGAEEPAGTVARLALVAEIARLRAVVDVALEWSAERRVSDWGEAELLKALWTFEGDSVACEGCDGECGEPCAPSTVAETHASIDREIERLVKAGKLHRSEPLLICGNCDTALPTGCGGSFKDDGNACRLNLGPNVKVNRHGTDAVLEGQNEMAACKPGSRAVSG